MIRTQQTAQPLADLSREPVTVLPGLREIEAGIYEGQPEALAGFTYYEAPTRWLQGDRTARIPGSIDGDEFDARFDEAVREIYDSEDTDPVAFSHAGAIMTWVAMNVDNPDLGLLSRHPLGNTGHAVVKGNPTGGWTLVDWAASTPNERAARAGHRRSWCELHVMRGRLRCRSRQDCAVAVHG